ncbi:hypothetical protein HF086_000342 [Spodoptera exigua]|uniref:Cytochrome p450 n=1 Tax=Spodoptera exigua TaxID=7107 RepID=A0A922M6G8_SPOEX|nr:hypothetical protein HF086_000342 [Spodoptera exigua]
MIFAVLIVSFCALLVLWSKLKPRGPSPPVHPGALPILGHAHQLYGDPKKFWVTKKKMYQFSLDSGGVSEIRLGPHSVYVLTDPDDSLVIANTCLNKPYYYDFAKEMFNRGLVTASLTTWKPHRKLLYPAFNMQVLATFVTEYNTQSRNLVAALKAEVGKEPFNVIDKRKVELKGSVVKNKTPTRVLVDVLAVDVDNSRCDSYHLFDHYIVYRIKTVLGDEDKDISKDDLQKLVYIEAVLKESRLYAMLVMKTMLAHILRKFLIISDINSITTQYDILIKPADNSQIRLELRSE